MAKKHKSKMVDPMAYWMKKYDRKSKKEGWSLFNADGFVYVMKIDLPEKGDAELKDDSEAIEMIVRRAMSGDKMCATAVYLEGREVITKVDLPVGLQ